MLAALLFGGALAAFYALTYYLNHKTPVPKGCEDLKDNCDGCGIHSCGHNPSQDIGGHDNA